jgi:hypothetical protein
VEGAQRQQEAEKPSAAVGAFGRGLERAVTQASLAGHHDHRGRPRDKAPVPCISDLCAGLAPEHSLGAVGLLFPWLMSSKWLHYCYTFVMLVGLVVLRPVFVGQARLW